ncbi:MAG: hypothetical protein QM755_00050 [Luteolibacter sp.]
MRTGATFFIAGWWFGANMKPMPNALDAFGDPLGRKIEVDAQRLQHVRAAGLARHAAPAVLAVLGTRRRRDEHRAGRDIEGMRAVAAGAHDVDQVRRVAHMHLGRELAHHLRGGCDLADGFLLHAQAGDEARPSSPASTRRS